MNKNLALFVLAVALAVTGCTGNPLAPAPTYTPQPTHTELPPQPTYTPYPTLKPPTSAPTTEPTTEPTQVPPTPKEEAPASGQAVACKTDSDVLELFGFADGEVVRTDAPWDSCKWNRQNTPSMISFILLEDWGLTYTDAQGAVWATIGQGQWIEVRGFTLRQPGNQFLQLDPNGYFEKEWTYGQAPERGDATFFTCPDENLIDLVTLSATQKEACQ